MKKITKIFSIIISLLVFVTLTSCSNKEPEVEEHFDKPATDIDHYFSDRINFAQTNTTLGNNKFITNKVAKLKPKSITDGDTAVFYLDGENDSYTNSIGKSYNYLTVRFLSIDTPESTSSIDPWGKAASKYVKELLTNATGIIVDATDLSGSKTDSYKGRIDSNGTRWLALIWYTNAEDSDDLTQYRLLQLDVIEECYSRYTGSLNSERYALEVDENVEPLLYSRYEFGSMKIGDVLYEAEARMEGLKLRKFGQLDPNYDYTKTPTEITIKEAITNFETYEPKATFIAITGVITRFIGNNFYMCDAEGYAIYVYMGIDGNSINRMFNEGDTINIRGRLAEYGGQKQLSGVVFAEETFKKITGENAIPMPEPIALTGTETSTQLDAVIGKLVKTTLTLDTNLSNVSYSKDKSYTLYTTCKVSDLSGKTSYDTVSVRINGSLAPGYEPKDFVTSATYEVVGIMSIYFEPDLTKDENYASYQLVVGNRHRIAENSYDSSFTRK